MLLITLKEVWSHNTMMREFCIPVPFSAASLRLLNSTMKSMIKKCWPLLIALRPGVTTSKDRRISSKSIWIIRTWYGSQKLKVIIAARLAGPRNLPLSTSPLPIDQAPEGANPTHCQDDQTTDPRMEETC